MYWRRSPARAPKRAAPVPAAFAMIADQEFADLPFGGFAGETTIPSQPATPAPPPRELVIEPPNWAEEERLLREQGIVENEPRLSAHEEMMAAALERGEIDEPGPVPVPMQPLPPLERFVPPEPDWRAEEREQREREAREQAAAAQDAYEPEPERWPARRKT